MFNKFRKSQQTTYNKSRSYFLSNPDILINLEEYISSILMKILQDNADSIKTDYNEASYLYPFWQQYPPDDRGRKPRGDQFPWIEVGEHSIGDRLSRLLQNSFLLRDSGLPMGTDKRYVLSNKSISEITKGYTDSVWLFVDIKSVGPRDDSDHVVMSHNQISGDGTWNEVENGVVNSVMMATGKNRKHKFHCSLPPLYILSDGTIAPVVLIALKPVYKMLSLENPNSQIGQPLKKITLVSIPNGLLLEENPGYLKIFPGLFFPGKDDKMKNPQKKRSRVSFQFLKKIAVWRVQNLLIE